MTVAVDQANCLSAIRLTRERLGSPGGAGGSAARPLEALVGLREVGEALVERLGALVHAVAQQVVGCLVEVGRKRRGASYRLDGDVDDVVFESAAIREARVVATQDAHAIALA